MRRIFARLLESLPIPVACDFDRCGRTGRRLNLLISRATPQTPRAYRPAPQPAAMSAASDPQGNLRELRAAVRGVWQDHNTHCASKRCAASRRAHVPAASGLVSNDRPIPRQSRTIALSSAGLFNRPNVRSCRAGSGGSMPEDANRSPLVSAGAGGKSASPLAGGCGQRYSVLGVGEVQLLGFTPKADPRSAGSGGCREPAY